MYTHELLALYHSVHNEIAKLSYFRQNQMCASKCPRGTVFSRCVETFPLFSVQQTIVSNKCYVEKCVSIHLPEGLYCRFCPSRIRETPEI